MSAYAEAQYTIDELSKVVKATSWKLQAPTAIKVVNKDKEVKLTWTDPENVEMNGAIVSEWAKTVVVRKQGSAPTSITDGTVVTITTVRNQHATEPVSDTGLTNDTTYYYGIFPVSKLDQATIIDGCIVAATPRAYIAYAIHIQGGESDTGSIVTYPEGYDNSNFTDPAYMDFTNKKFHWGDWEKAFFIPRSCMLKYDGAVDYYLDENDETKKVDGTASDVANTSYAGNAMMEWGSDDYMLWWKVVPDSDEKGCTFVIATAQIDDDMEAWNHINSKGGYSTHFYTPKYFGSNVSSKLRSISGTSGMVSQTAATEISYAKANNLTSDEIWNTEVYADWQLINFLLIMMCKSTNTQTKFGYGRCASGNQNAIANGTLNGKGMFYGDTTQTNGVKVFGMENRWGNIWRRIAGYMNVSGTVKVKMCYGNKDGSIVDKYNTDGSGYVTMGTIGGTSGGYIKEMSYSKLGMVPKTISGSDSTYFTDGAWFNNSQTDYARVGGDWNHGLLVGEFCSALNDAASYSDANVGSALSCKPLT